MPTKNGNSFPRGLKMPDDKHLIIKDANDQLRVVDPERVLELIEKEDINILGLSFQAIRALKKWFFKFGGEPRRFEVCEIDEVFKKPYESYIKNPILDEKDEL